MCNERVKVVSAGVRYLVLIRITSNAGPVRDVGGVRSVSELDAGSKLGAGLTRFAAL